MKRSSQPTILIIIGITGDLSRRKLLPAIEQIAKAQALPKQMKVVGVTRQQLSKDTILKSLGDKQPKEFLDSNLEIFHMDLTKKAEYERLDDYLSSLEKDFDSPAQRLFYLSVPPQISQPVITLLGAAGLAKIANTKLLLEKPFGSDLASAQELIAETKKYFEEDQVYRIDHYLAKEMAQNMLVFRAGNSLFKHSWNKDFIDSICIVASEDIGIEGRTTFYEQTGALRDVVQSHLLQLTALTLMECPTVGKDDRVPKSRLQALQKLTVAQPLKAKAIRGQYEGYRKEVNNLNSSVETYASIELHSSDPIWHDVPITLTTGKHLSQKVTEIRISYKKELQYSANELIIRFQPNEGIELCVWTKVPGYEWQVEQHSLRLALKEESDMLPEAYEQVLLDAISSSHTFFTTSEEVLESWRILEPVQKAWTTSTDDILVYPPHTPVGEVGGAQK